MTEEELPSVGRKTSIRDLQLDQAQGGTASWLGGPMHPATLLKLLWNCLNETKGQRHHADLKTPQSLMRSSVGCTPHNKPDPWILHPGFAASIQVPDSTAHKQVLGPYPVIFFKCFECDSNVAADSCV